MVAKKRIAYVEIGSNGHRPIWIRSVCEAVERNWPDWRLEVWVPEDFAHIHPWSKQYWEQCEDSEAGIYFRSLQSSVSPKPVVDFSLYQIAKKCASLSKSDACFVGNTLDNMIYEIALDRPNQFHGKIVGVSDRPFLHYIKFQSSRTKTLDQMATI